MQRPPSKSQPDIDEATDAVPSSSAKSPWSTPKVITSQSSSGAAALFTVRPRGDTYSSLPS